MLPFIPHHEAGNPWNDLINVPGLHAEWLSSDFEKIDDLKWLSSLGHQVPSEERTIQNLLTPEPPFQSMSSHGFESTHADLSLSQPSMQFDYCDDSLLPLLWTHPPLPEPQVTPQNIQVQSLVEHSASPCNPQSTQHNFQGQASHQIQSLQPSEDFTYNEGKYKNWDDFYFQVTMAGLSLGVMDN